MPPGAPGTGATGTLAALDRSGLKVRGWSIMSDEGSSVGEGAGGRIRRRPVWPTADQLRAHIDSGAAGDKNPAVDPSAAPLGTDEEAAGTPLTREDLHTAYAAESRVVDGARPPNADRDVGEPPRTAAEPGSRRRGRLGSPMAWGVLALLVLGVAFVLFR
jgi:hypothetical protein